MTRPKAALLLITLLTCADCASGSTHAARWQQLAGGGALAGLGADLSALSPPNGPPAEGRMAVVRMNALAHLEVHAADAARAQPPSAEGWSGTLEAPHVVWNAGFYGKHGRHVGLLKAAGQWLQRQWQPDWRGLVLAGPTRAGLPAWQLVDLDGATIAETELEALIGAYDHVVQTMVLMDATGRLRTHRSPKAAARTALCLDQAGQLLVVVTEGPWTLEGMADALQAIEPRVVWALNLDGGLESQLSVRTADGRGLHLTSRHGSHGALPEPWTARLPTRGLPAVFVLRP